MPKEDEKWALFYVHVYSIFSLSQVTACFVTKSFPAVLGLLWYFGKKFLIIK